MAHHLGDRQGEARSGGAATGTRQRLPDRRLAHHERVTWRGAPWDFAFGVDGAGHVREVFLDGGIKPGSESWALIEDVCVLVSLMLQTGMGAGDLAAHLARESNLPGEPAASLAGLIADTAARVEAEEGAALARAQARGATGAGKETRAFP